MVAVGHEALGAHAVDLLVVVKVLRLVEGRGDDHALGRLVIQRHLGIECALRTELLHLGEERALAGLHIEDDIIALFVDLGAPRGGGLRKVRFAEREHTHGTRGDLPALLKIQQRHGVQPHVAVVRDREAQRKAAVVHTVIVPLLQPQDTRLHIRAAVDREQLFRVARLGQIPGGVEQHHRARDLMLVHSPRSFLWRRMSVPMNGRVWYSPSRRERICAE